MTGYNEHGDQTCPECGAGFGWDDEEDTFAKFDARCAEVYRGGPDGDVFVSVEFDCPDCGEALILEDASGPGFGTDPRPNR